MSHGSRARAHHPRRPSRAIWWWAPFWLRFPCGAFTCADSITAHAHAHAQTNLGVWLRSPQTSSRHQHGARSANGERLRTLAHRQPARGECRGCWHACHRALRLLVARARRAEPAARRGAHSARSRGGRRGGLGLWSNRRRPAGPAAAELRPARAFGREHRARASARRGDCRRSGRLVVAGAVRPRSAGAGPGGGRGDVAVPQPARGVQRTGRAARAVGRLTRARGGRAAARERCRWRAMWEDSPSSTPRQR